MDAIIHVLRCFENDDIQHVDNKIDPVSDAETVETELMLSDLESLEKRVPAAQKKAAQGDKESKLIASVLAPALELLREGKPARLAMPQDEEERRVFGQAQLLTAKPVLYVCNVDEESAANGNAFSARVFEKARAEGANAVIVSAAIESELTGMDDEERMVFLEEMGLHETGLARVIRSGYDLLHLITFFTVGPRKPARGLCIRAPRPPKPPEKSTPTCNAASSVPKPSPTTISSRWAAKALRAMPESCGRKARNTWSRMATFCTSNSTSEAI